MGMMFHRNKLRQREAELKAESPASVPEKEQAKGEKPKTVRRSKKTKE